jgi:hypothetical protein
MPPVIAPTPTLDWKLMDFLIQNRFGGRKREKCYFVKKVNRIGENETTPAGQGPVIRKIGHITVLTGRRNLSFHGIRAMRHGKFQKAQTWN